jgi:hypothetical protein
VRRPRPANAELRVERLAVLPGGSPTWQVVGQPFRVVAVGRAWRLVAVGAHNRDLLAEHDLLGPFTSRGAALDALRAVMAPPARRGPARERYRPHTDVA